MATSQASNPASTPRAVREAESIVIRFCGDSGDGMQLTGSEFTKSSALAGNDLATLPDFPAEIRAPAGTLAGVSASSCSSRRARSTRPATSPTSSWP